MNPIIKTLSLIAALFISATATVYSADLSCADLPGWSSLKKELAVATKNYDNGGFGLNVWATVVNRDGIVCAVAYTGNSLGEQWPGSRVISAQKANTANAFSLPRVAISTANLYSATQPGGSLYGLQHSNPVNTALAYKGPSSNYGKANDPMVGGKIGGINVFGGGLALYNSKGQIIGGIGVSGESSCADHNIAWHTRALLDLHFVPSGFAVVNVVNNNGTEENPPLDFDRPDNIVYDIDDNGVSKSGWGHPLCSSANQDVDLKHIANELPALP